MSREFTGISILSENVARLAEFYGKLLQIEVDLDDVFVEIGRQGYELSIYSKESADSAMGFDFSRYWGSGNIAIEFHVDDVDEEFERLKKMGVDFIKPPTTYPEGNRMMHFRDLDGNIITFANRCINNE